MPRYLLPCSCGQLISIDTIQAGQEVRCSCGKAQLVPTLREIRQLPEAEPAMTQLRLVKEPWSAKSDYRLRHWPGGDRFSNGCG